MSSANSISKEQFNFVRKNQAFNALTFVFSCLVSLFRQIDGEKRGETLMELFKPLYDDLSKEFVPDFSSMTSSNEGTEGHEPDSKSAYKG